MPAAYAHHTFGESCLENMPEKVRAVCLKYREAYDFGVHGPDLLFYYKPLSSNEVNRHGSGMHHQKGRDFFEACSLVYNENPSDKQMLLAYLLGFLAHFTLDSCCHGYINQMTEASEYSHNLIESQYEVYLMKKDGKDPMKVDRSKVLKPSERRAAVISQLFPFDAKTILSCMKGQKMTLHLFYSPAQVKKRFVRMVIGRLHVNADFADLFLDNEVLPGCEVFNEEIYARQKKAVELYPQLMKEMMRSLYGKGKLGAHFQYDFEGELQE